MRKYLGEWGQERLGGILRRQTLLRATNDKQ